MKKRELTPSQRCELWSAVGTAGTYGLDAEDAGADSWITRFVCFADSLQTARGRVRDAGFHKQRTWSLRRPRKRPTGGRTWPDLEPGDVHWYRSRLDDSGWTPWERLPEDYRHPPQGRAAINPSVR